MNIKLKLFPVLMTLLSGYSVSAQVMTTSSASAENTDTHKTVSLQFLETTDVHGSFFGTDLIKNAPSRGSLSRIYTLVDSLRTEKADRLILLDNGDILQGDPSAYWANYIDTLGTHLVASIMNFMQYDAATIGNHDVETGHAVYDRWASELNCPLLGANVIDTATNKPYFKPYVILEREGVKIAIFGQITDAIPAWLPANIWSGLRFDNMVENAKQWISKIKEEEKPDLIVGLFHSGLKGGIINDSYYENAAYKVANEVEGFDVVFFGHDHSPHSADIVNKWGKHVLLVNPGAHATNVASAVANFTVNQSGKVVSKTLSADLIDATVYPESGCFTKRFKKDLQAAEKFVSTQVASLEVPIDGRAVLFGSSSFVDLIHEMQLAKTGADISLSSPLSTSSVIEAGPLRMRDLFKLYKYENKLYTMHLTGQEVRDELEYSYSKWVNTMKSSKDHLLLLDDHNHLQYFSFNFDSAAGIIYEVDVTKPVGKRVSIRSMADGSPFSLTKMYTVAVNSYRGNGGGELLTRGAGIAQDSLSQRIIKVSTHDLRYYLMQYLLSKKTITPEPLKQWSFVPEKWVTKAASRDSLLIYSSKNMAH